MTRQVAQSVTVQSTAHLSALHMFTKAMSVLAGGDIQGRLHSVLQPQHEAETRFHLCQYEYKSKHALCCAGDDVPGRLHSVLQAQYEAETTFHLCQCEYKSKHALCCAGGDVQGGLHSVLQAQHEVVVRVQAVPRRAVQDLLGRVEAEEEAERNL